MPRNKNRANYNAIELGVSSGDDIELLGIQPLVDKQDYIATGFAYQSDNHDSLSFKNIIGDGYRCNYLLEQIRPSSGAPDNVRYSEKGVGSIYVKGKRSFLKRELPISYCDSSDGGTTKLCAQDSRPHKFCDEECYLRVTSYIPKNYQEALHSPFSVIVSKDSFVPYPVQLEEASLLGRLDDEVQAIDMGELQRMDGFSEAVTDSLIKSQRQLNIKARHLVLDRKNAKLAASSLQALPVCGNDNKPPPQAGMIIFNQDRSCLEFFDGNKWNKLIWEDDNESTS